MTLFLALLVSFTIVYSSIGYFLLSKPPAQPFIGVGIYSQSGSLANYYSGNGPNVTAGQSLSWHFQLFNRMGSVQLVRIVYRLVNVTMSSPTETTSSNASQIGESSTFVTNEENETIPFEWTLVSRQQSGTLTYVTLQINGQTITPPVGTRSGQEFRFIFELWTLNDQSGALEYSSPNGRVGTWLAVWFNTS